MLKINVGGTIFTTSKDTVQNNCSPNFFSSYLKWRPRSNYIFVDRDPTFFNLILNHLRGYTITLPSEHKDLYMIYEDADFYGISTLTTQLEEILAIKLDIKKRADVEFQVRKNAFDSNYKIPQLDLLSDRELLYLKDILEKYIKEKEREDAFASTMDSLNVLFNIINEKYNKHINIEDYREFVAESLKMDNMKNWMSLLLSCIINLLRE